MLLLDFRHVGHAWNRLPRRALSGGLSLKNQVVDCNVMVDYTSMTCIIFTAWCWMRLLSEEES